MTQYEQGYTDGELDGRNVGYQEGKKMGYGLMLKLIKQEIDKEFLDYIQHIEEIGDTARQARVALGIVRNIIDKWLESVSK